MGGDEFQKSDQNPFFTLRDKFVAHHNQARENLFKQLVDGFNKVNLHKMYIKLTHKLQFDKASTLSQVDAELTVERFVTMLNDAGFFVNYYDREVEEEPKHGFGTGRTDDDVIRRTRTYLFCIYWDFSNQIKAINEEDNFLKQNPSYELESIEYNNNIFVKLRNDFIHEQAKLRLNFEQSLTDELMASINNQGTKKTGEVIMTSKLFEPINYWRRGYHAGSIARHNLTIGKEPLISTEPRHSPPAQVIQKVHTSFGPMAFSINFQSVPFIGEHLDNGSFEVFISGNSALYLDRETKQGWIVNLSKRCEMYAARSAKLEEIFQPLNPCPVPIKGLGGLRNHAINFYAQPQGKAFIISILNNNRSTSSNLFYHNISSEPIDMAEIHPPDNTATGNIMYHEYLFHPNKNQFLSTLDVSPPRGYNNSRSETRLFKFTTKKISLINPIFTDKYAPQPTMRPVFSNNGSVILSMYNGAIISNENGKGTRRPGAYGDAERLYSSTNKEFWFTTTKGRRNGHRTSFIFDKSGTLVKTIYDSAISSMVFCEGDSRIEEAINRVMTMVEEAGISIQMEGNASFRMTWDWEV